MPDHASGREFDAGNGGGGLQDGIDARSRISSGSTNYDRPAGKSGAEEETGQENCQHKGIKNTQIYIILQ